MPTNSARRHLHWLLPQPDDALVRMRGAGLVWLIAILTFLAALTAGSVYSVRATAAAWRSDVAREVTIQLRAAPAKELQANIARATDLAKATRGVRNVRALTSDETRALLEPWLGKNPDLKSIPVPQLLIVELADPSADLADLRKRLTEQIRGATLDDHRGYQGRLVRAADAISAAGFAVLAMVFAATAISVMIAATGAVSANRNVVEVLHFIGARQHYVTRLFQRRFFVTGLKGASAGALLAILPFAVARWRAAGDATVPFTPDGFAVALDVWGYAGMLALALLVAATVALTARFTVQRILRRIG